MTITHVQGAVSADGDATSATTVAVAFAGTVGSANLVVGAVMWGSDTTTDLTSVTDDKGNTYTIADRQASGGDAESLAVFYLANITNAPKTITANFGSSQAFRRIVIDEFSGIATTTPIDGHGINWSSTAGTTPVSPSITTTVNGDLVYGVTGDTNGDLSSATNFTAGTGYGIDTNGGGSVSLAMASEHQVQSAAGAITAGFTVSRAALHWATAVIAFKAAATGTTRTATSNVGALLQKTQTKTASAGALLQKTQTATASAGALLQKTHSASASADGYVATSRLASASVDAVMATGGTRTASLTAYLFSNRAAPPERIAYVIPERP